MVLHIVSRDDEQPVHVGLVVGRAVGNAVTRNTVKRRLRHLVATRLDALPQAATLVIRANPSAATTGWSGLGTDLDSCLRRLDRGHAPRKQQATPVTA